MNRLMLFGVLAGSAAWVLFRYNNSAKRIVAVDEAAAKLRQAWADHHTTA